MSRHKTVLLLLTRSPEQGKVKTRLIPELGEEQATQAHIELVTNTLKMLNQCEAVDKQLWLNGKRHVFEECFQCDFEIFPQLQDELGKNMYEAARQASVEYEQVIIIGSDCPDLSYKDIHAAKTLLDENTDVVIGPAEDGGYYLIAFNTLYQELFSGVTWGTSKVLDETMEKAQALSLKVETLQVHFDVDMPQDYARFKCLI